ncbi:hypothetical protein NP493_1173g00006 [Ridgeia piscesae]|uniref:Uncharacterized protein n=1 Tax=Ridgeia piscesae TaxID=27915 RepID=A0AAD9KG19_RIDPI|nr:hypothetical protein NP493_1173g00006 [Ridgeia piscesae]
MFPETMYDDFVNYPQMMQIRDRTLWVHVQIPGQAREAPDLPSEYTFPSMNQVGEDLIHVLDELKIKQVVCFGEGAGAHILGWFAIAHVDRVMGVCLIHCIGTTTGFMESVKDKMISWKFNTIGMNPSAEAYLVLHRFGSVFQLNKAKDKDQVKAAIENYQSVLRTSTNTKNLKKFVESFLKRSNLSDRVKKLTCPVLLVAGQKSVFNQTTKSFHQSLVKQCADKGRVEFISIDGVANILEEAPDKLAESFQYFLQGLGVVSAVPMQHVTRIPRRMRSLSMEEYDKPKLRSRSMSGGSDTISPLSSSPPAVPMLDAPAE